MSVNFEVNKQGLVVDGVARDVGFVVSLSDLGQAWRGLLSSGQIRRVDQTDRDAFKDGQRFKRESKLDYPRT